MCIVWARRVRGGSLANEVEYITEALLQTRPLPTAPGGNRKFLSSSESGATNNMPGSISDTESVATTVSGSFMDQPRWLSKENLFSDADSLSDDSGQHFIALYDFQPVADKQLQLRKGEGFMWRGNHGS